MADYKSNSHRSKEASQDEVAERKVEKVVSGNVKVRKKSGLGKLTDAFIAKDIEDVGSYIAFDIVIPLLKDGFMNIVSTLLYGEQRSNKNNSGSRVSYTKYYRDGGRSEPTVRRERPNYEDLVFDDRGDAEYVLNSMKDIIKRYGYVTIHDLYDLADVKASYTDRKYGWTNLDDAYTERVREGTVIKLPRPMVID